MPCILLQARAISPLTNFGKLSSKDFAKTLNSPIIIFRDFPFFINLKISLSLDKITKLEKKSAFYEKTHSASAESRKSAFSSRRLTEKRSLHPQPARRVVGVVHVCTSCASCVTTCDHTCADRQDLVVTLSGSPCQSPQLKFSLPAPASKWYVTIPRSTLEHGPLSYLRLTLSPAPSM